MFWLCHRLAQKPSDVPDYILGYVHMHLGSSDTKQIKLLVIPQTSHVDSSLCVLIRADKQPPAIEILPIFQVSSQIWPHSQIHPFLIAIYTTFGPYSFPIILMVSCVCGMPLFLLFVFPVFVNLP